MVVGDKGYQLNLTRLAFSFNGSISMDYLQDVGVQRIQELSKHANVLREELKKNG